MGLDLYQDLKQQTAMLDMALKDFSSNGRKLAEAEKNYKIKLREEVLKLRDTGTAIGVIDKIAYGIPSIAQLRFERDCAKAVYVANMEAINVKKLQIRIIQEQINKEFSNVD